MSEALVALNLKAHGAGLKMLEWQIANVEMMLTKPKLLNSGSYSPPLVSLKMMNMTNYCALHNLNYKASAITSFFNFHFA